MDLTISQNIILGIIQGIFEWIPISSSAFVTLVMTNFFSITDVDFILRSALMLHLGTFFAALIYFRKDVSKLFVSFFNYKNSGTETKKILPFLVISTIISGIIGFGILKIVESSSRNFLLSGKIISLVIAVLLLITGIIQLKIKNKGIKKTINLRNSDGVMLGFAQGISALPGLSRSGMTVSTLLLRKFDDTTSLRLSFLMSLPIVLVGNIFLSIDEFVFTYASLFGLLFSFLFGIFTIHILMRIAKKVNFGYFLLIFSVLLGLSSLL